MNASSLLRQQLGLERGRSGPLLMGVVNASQDSFSDAGRFPTKESQISRALELVSGGAEIIDIGGESARTDRPQRSAEEEIELIVPLIAELAGRSGFRISVDTYKPAVATAAVAAGATIINDISGLRNAEIADVAARSGAALVITHNEGRPKRALLDPSRYADVTASVKQFLESRVTLAGDHGVSTEQVILDPGPDFSKTPRQTIEVLRNLGEIVALGLPVLLAVSRKDFIGALTDRAPDARFAGTLAAVEDGVRKGAAILRVHDVQGVSTFLTEAALSGDLGRRGRES